MNWIRAINVAVGLLLALSPGLASAAEGPTTRPSTRPVNVRDLLDQKIGAGVEFKATPLGDAFEWLRRESGLPLDVRWDVLATVGVMRETPVTLTVSFSQKASKSLSQIIVAADGGPDVDKRKLAHFIDDDHGQVVVTTAEYYIALFTVTREYDIRDLPVYQATERLPAARADWSADLIDLVKQTVGPDSWVDSGGRPGRITLNDGRLTITQTAENHVRVANLLEQIRETLVPADRQFGPPRQTP